MSGEGTSRRCALGCTASSRAARPAPRLRQRRGDRELAALGALVSGVDVDERLWRRPAHASRCCLGCTATRSICPPSCSGAGSISCSPGRARWPAPRTSKAWAAGLAVPLRPGGELILLAEHPILALLDEVLRWRGDYFAPEGAPPCRRDRDGGGGCRPPRARARRVARPPADAPAGRAARPACCCSWRPSRRGSDEAGGVTGRRVLHATSRHHRHRRRDRRERRIGRARRARGERVQPTQAPKARTPTSSSATGWASTPALRHRSDDLGSLWTRTVFTLCDDTDRAIITGDGVITESARSRPRRPQLLRQRRDPRAEGALRANRRLHPA